MDGEVRPGELGDPRYTPMPISQLHPDIPNAKSRVVNGVITTTWPYSVVKRSTAFTLAEHDPRLRRERGQVRVECCGAAGKAFSNFGIGGGDEIRICLDGAEWVKNETPSKTAGTPLEWQLKFKNRLLLQVQKLESSEPEVLDINFPPEEEHQDADSDSEMMLTIASLFEYEEQEKAMKTAPKSPNVSRPNKRLASTAFGETEYASPAYLKRARVSYGALWEGGFDMFDEPEDDGPKRKKRRKSRFSMNATWRYSSRSPSPEPEQLSDTETMTIDEPAADTMPPEPASTSPVRRPMVDSGCQTQDAELSPSMGVQVIAQSRLTGSLYQSTPTPTWRHRDLNLHPEISQTPALSFGQTMSSELSTPRMENFQSQDALLVSSHPLSYDTVNRSLTDHILTPAEDDSSVKPVPMPEHPATPAQFAYGMGANHFGAFDEPMHIDPNLEFESDVNIPQQPEYPRLCEEAWSSHVSTLPHPAIVAPTEARTDMADSVESSPQKPPSQQADRQAANSEPSIQSSPQSSKSLGSGLDRQESDAHSVVSFEDEADHSDEDMGHAEYQQHGIDDRKQGPGQGEDESDDVESEAESVTISSGEVEPEERPVRKIQHDFQSQANNDTLSEESGDEEQGLDEGSLDGSGEEISHHEILAQVYDESEEDYDEEEEEDYADDSRDHSLSRQEQERYYDGEDDGEDYDEDEEDDDEEDEEEEDEDDEDGEEEDGPEYEEEEDNKKLETRDAAPPVKSAPVFISLLSDSEDDSDTGDGKEHELQQESNVNAAKEIRAEEPSAQPENINQDLSIRQSNSGPLLEQVRDEPITNVEFENAEKSCDQDNQDIRMGDTEAMEENGLRRASLEEMSEEHKGDQGNDKDEGEEGKASSENEEQEGNAQIAPAFVSPALWPKRPKNIIQLNGCCDDDQEDTEVHINPGLQAENLLAASPDRHGDMSQRSKPVVQTQISTRSEPLEKAREVVKDGINAVETTNEIPQQTDGFQQSTTPEGSPEPVPMVQTALENEAASDTWGNHAHSEQDKDFTTHPISEHGDSVTKSTPVTAVHAEPPIAEDKEDVEMAMDSPGEDQEEYEDAPQEAHRATPPLTLSDIIKTSEIPKDNQDVEMVDDTYHQSRVELEDVGPKSPSVTRVEGIAKQRTYQTTDGPSSEDVPQEEFTTPPDTTAIEDVGMDDERAQPVNVAEEEALVLTNGATIPHEISTPKAASSLEKSEIEEEPKGTRESQERQVTPPSEEIATQLAPEPILSPPPTQLPPSQMTSSIMPIAAQGKHDSAIQLPTPYETQVEEEAPIPSQVGSEASQDDEDDEDDVAAQQQLITELEASQSMMEPPEPPETEPDQNPWGLQQEPQFVITLQSLRSHCRTHRSSMSIISGEGSDPNNSLLRSPTKYGHCLKDLGPPMQLRVTRGRLSEMDPSILLAKASQASSEADISKESMEPVRLARGKPNFTDPSILLAQTNSPSPTTSVRASPSPLMRAPIRVARPQANEPDPSVQLAEAPTPKTTQRRSPPAPIQTVQRVGSRNQTPERESTAREALKSPFKAPSVVESVPEETDASALKMQLSKTLRKTLPDYLPLRSLRHSLSKLVDILAVATTTPSPPHRPKTGPRDFMIELRLTDPTCAATSIHVCHIFRPHKTSLPIIHAGDVILLRRVQVVAMQGRGFGFRAGDASAWAVFEKEDQEMLPQIKGPPVEITDEETEYASGLRYWWSMLDKKTLNKMERANEKL